MAKINYKYRKDNKVTWHHHQDGKTLQLIKRDLHNAVKHLGGISKK
jgi:hypothetical protein